MKGKMGKQPLASAKKIVSELKLTPEDVDKYEECEIICDLIDREALREIEDEELRRILARMRALHAEVRKANYPAYAEAAKSLFDKLPNKNCVLKYHALEGLSREISDEEIRRIKDESLRYTLAKVKHVHDNIAEKKANVIRRIKLY